MADLRHVGQFARTLLCGNFWSRRLRQKVARSLHFKRILMSREDHLRRAVFQAPKLGLLLSHFPLVPLCRISENGQFRSLCPICQNSALRTLLEPPFAAKGCSIIAPEAHINEQRRAFAPSFFSSL